MRNETHCCTSKLISSSSRAELRLLTNPDQSFPGPLSVPRRDLNSDGASDRVVAHRKATHSNQVLDSLALDDIPNSLGVQGDFRYGD